MAKAKGCSQAGMGKWETNMEMEKSGMSSKGSEHLILFTTLTGKHCAHAARTDSSWVVCSTN